MKKALIAALIIFAALPVLAATAVKTTQTSTQAAKPTTNKTMTKDDRANAYYEQGYTYYMAGSYKQAGPEFVKALKLEPKMAKAYYWKAKTDYKLSKYRTATANVDAAIKLEPKNRSFRTLRKDATLKQNTIAAASSAKRKARAAAIANAVADNNAATTMESKVAEGPRVTVPKAAETPATEPVAATATASSTEPVTSSPVKPVQQPVTAPSNVDVTVVHEKLIADTTIPKQKQLISLDLRNVDISSVLQVFSQETGMNIISGQDVYGKVTVVINKMEADQALDMILKSNGYTYSKDGNTVHVYSSGEPPRLEELPDGVFVRSFTINYMDPDQLKDTIVKLMPEDSNIYTTKGSNAIVVKGSAEDIRRAEILIRNLDVPPRQVMVEAKIVEVSLDQNQNMGMNWSYTDPNKPGNTAQTVAFANTPTDPNAQGLYYTVTNDNPNMLLNILSTRTGFNILSSPKVMALNNQKATIVTGSELGYTIKTVTTTGILESVAFLDVGTMLTITPSIKSDGLIVMDIHPEVSEGTIVNDLPQKQTTETTTQLIVKDGQTIIIGGLVRETSTKATTGVPILMDIPLVGALFKQTNINSEKMEIIVLITPHIVNSRMSADMDEKIKQMEESRRKIAPTINLDLIR